MSGAQLYVLRTLSKESGLGSWPRPREPSESDKRRIELSITLKGTILLGKAPPPIQEHLLRAIHELPPKSKQELAKLLQRLITQARLDHTDAVMFFEDPESK